MNFEKTITLQPAFDKRHTDPKKNYGIHGVDLRMILKGDRGATQFILYTGWMLPHVKEELGNSEPLPADLGYHSPTPQYEDQHKMDCDILDGECYYDGSGLNANRIYNVLLEKGSAGVWDELEEYYNQLFNEELTK